MTRPVGRPRLFDDDAVFAATTRVLGQLGHEHFTIDAVACAVGCTGPALIRRFGSKQRLLAAFVQWSNAGARERFEQLSILHDSPLTALRERFRMPSGECAEAVDCRQQYWNLIVFHVVGWVDPTLRPAVNERHQLFRMEIARLLAAAVDAGELRACDTERLSGTLATALLGSALQSVFDASNSIEAHFRCIIDDVLNPYVTTTAA